MQKKILLSACFIFITTLSFSFAEISPSIPSQGLVIGMENGMLVVEKVYAGSAGDNAGIEVGDVILTVGETTAAGMTPRDLGYALDFNPGSVVSVALIRDDVTKFVYLARRNPFEQWKLAWKQDQIEYAKNRRFSSQQKGGEGALVLAPGQISYATTDAELDAMAASATGGPGGEGRNLAPGSITYEVMYEQLLKVRKQLIELTHSVNRLTEKVEFIRPNHQPPPRKKASSEFDDLSAEDEFMPGTADPIDDIVTEWEKNRK